MRLTKLIVLLLVASLALAACGSDKKKSEANNNAKGTPTTILTTSTTSTSAYSGGGGTGSTTIEATEFKFTPATVSAKAGDSVTLTFKNAGTAEHNFSITTLKVSEDAEKGAVKTVKFTAPAAAGDVEFFCKYHKASYNMVGTLHVT
jgi:plastocyanin